MGDNKITNFTKKYGNNKHSKMYLLVGGKEGEEMESDAKKYKDLLLDSGFKQKNLTLKINPEGKHNEAFWSSEFLEVITWLYNIKN